jgi:bifunctional non-homologous end joining protein LigD
VFLRAFDLIELNGDDLRREPLICRKSTLAVVIARADDGIELNDHMEHDDAAFVFEHACKLGFEGIISKRQDSSYCSGRSPDWIRLKNPSAPAVKREAEEGLEPQRFAAALGRASATRNISDAGCWRSRAGNDS